MIQPPEADVSGEYIDTIPYKDLVELVIEQRDELRAMHERLRVLENRLAHVPVEQARMAI